jgi:hypothetical protein
MIALAAGLKDGTEMIDAADRLVLPGASHRRPWRCRAGWSEHASRRERDRRNVSFGPKIYSANVWIRDQSNDLAGALSLLPKL